MKMNEQTFKRVPAFKYTGTNVSEYAELNVEIDSRISRWKAWKKLIGLLFDRKINVRLKEKGHKTAVLPEMMYGSKTRVMNTVYMKKMAVAEIRMLN